MEYTDVYRDKDGNAGKEYGHSTMKTNIAAVKKLYEWQGQIVPAEVDKVTSKFMTDRAKTFARQAKEGIHWKGVDYVTFTVSQAHARWWWERRTFQLSSCVNLQTGLFKQIKWKRTPICCWSGTVLREMTISQA